MANEANLPDVVQAMRSPAAYDHPIDGPIELIQTHISYVLLAGDFAYKIKKPLDLGFLDYSTLEKRRRMCEEEVRLNRRLCEETYLGVATIVAEGTTYRIASSGVPVEYAVKMRRVASDRMMPALLKRGLVDSRELQGLARLLAAFHANGETDDRISSFGQPLTIGGNWRENFDQVAPYVGRSIDAKQLAAIRGYVEATLTERAELFAERVASGRIRDCHGDLRADAVVIHDDGSICVMDCIEFNDRIRYGDVAGDIGFLAMDLDYRGYGALSDELAGAYVTATRDETLPLVLTFYKCYRAFVRGKVESLIADEPEVPMEQRDAAAERARGYFALALEYATTRREQSLVVMVGITGSGKTYLANAVAGRLGAVVISSDAVRDELSVRTPESDAYASGRYTDERRTAVFAEMRDRAAAYLRDGHSVILDATHIARSDRQRAYAVARDASARVIVVHVNANEDLTRAHLAERQRDASAASEGRWEIYVRQREAFEPLDEAPAESIVLVDGARPLGENVARVLVAAD